MTDVDLDVVYRGLAVWSFPKSKSSCCLRGLSEAVASQCQDPDPHVQEFT